jgi:hypothetical protein
VSDRTFEAIGRALELGGDADDVLRAVVAELERKPEVQWAAVLFLEDGQLELGPERGIPNEEQRIHVPVAYRGTVVGELAVDGDADRAVLDRVAAAISAHVLLGWDTGGEIWEP